MIETIPTEDKPTIANTTISKRVSRMLGLSLDSWNGIMLGSLGAAALAAFAVVVSTTAVIRLQKAAEVETERQFNLYKIEASKNIAEANERAKIADEKAAAASLEQEQLKAQLSWRELSAKQLSNITNRLSGKILNMVLWHLSTDPEATNLYLQLKASFEAAGVKFGPDDDRALVNSGVPRYGVLVAGKGPEVSIVGGALKEAGIKVTGSDITSETLNVWIGTKPRPTSP